MILRPFWRFSLRRLQRVAVNCYGLRFWRKPFLQLREQSVVDTREAAVAHAQNPVIRLRVFAHLRHEGINLVFADRSFAQGGEHGLRIPT